MNLSDFSLMKEDDNSYTIGHPQGKSMRVTKAGLSDKAQALIGKLKKVQKLADGGEVEPAIADSVTDSPDQIVSDAQAQAPASLPGVTAQNEIAANPQASPQAPVAPQPQSDAASLVPDVTGALTNEKSAIQKGEAAEGLAGAETAGAYDKYAQDLGAQLTPQQIFQKHQQADQDLQKAFADKSLDPQRFIHNMSTGSKIAAGIGMLLSGFGSGLTGQPNLAVDSINKAIERDIDAQKNDQSKAMNLWKMNREATQDETQATLATQNQMLNVVKAKVASAAARAQGPMAQARGAATISQIDQQIASNNQVRSVLDAQAQGGFVQADPAQLVPYMVKDPAQQQKVYEEIGRAQNVGTNGSKIMKAFEDASNDNTVLSTGAGYLRTPGSVMALHQLLLPNFKQIDGTVRQAAMDETFHNVTPAPGDTQAKLASKRQALQDWMHSETAAPIAKGHLLDLSRFASTTADPRARLSPQQAAFYSEATQRLKVNPQDPAALAALNKLGVR